MVQMLDVGGGSVDFLSIALSSECFVLSVYLRLSDH
jgi:hypothetical protein